jgi:tetratricopeptide (TPR) repeat protein
MAQTYNNMGLVYQARGEWDKALEFYQKSLKIKEQVGDIHGMALTLGNIGFLKIKQGRFEEAVKPLEQAIDIFKQVGDERNVQKCQMALDWARACGKLDITTLLKDPDRLLKMLEAAERIPADKKEELKAILNSLSQKVLDLPNLIKIF